MNWLLIALCLFIALYTFRVVLWIRDWGRLPVLPASSSVPSLSVSIIIAARNEGHNIANLINSLRAQDYPKELTEIIIVDDHSTDDTASIAQQFEYIKYILLQAGEGKKKAIEQGIKAASGQFILCTDADCLPPSTWVSSMVSVYEETNAAFISAPVSLVKNGRSMAGNFDEMESAVLVAIGGASICAGRPSMCNGANLAYPKKVFEEVGGYTGNAHIPSGDDEFLMHKVAEKYPGKVYFLKDKKAVVTTVASPNWKSLFAQRSRWASKHRHYRSIKVKLELMLVLMANLSFPLLLAGSLSGIFDLRWAFGIVTIKLAVDLTMLGVAFRFFEKPIPIFRCILFQVYYPFYLIAVGIAANLFSYKWKGRKLK